MIKQSFEFARQRTDGRIQSPPAKLFKYRTMPGEGTPEETWRRDEISRNILYFARPGELNDPFDCRPSWILDAEKADVDSYLVRTKRERFARRRRSEREQLERIVRKRVGDRDFWRSFWQANVERYGVYCLTEENDHPLMWAHYADGHRGYCLEFTVSAEDWKDFAQPFAVVYFRERPRISTSEWLRASSSTPPDNFLEHTVLCKDAVWRYEKEWRMVRVPPAGGPGLVQCPPHLLSGIILGERMTAEDEARLRSWAADKVPAPAWYRSVSFPAKYGLEIVPVPAASLRGKRARRSRAGGARRPRPSPARSERERGRA